MAVTNFSPLLGLALPTTGDLSGTWGTTVNDSITSLTDSAVAGTTTLSTDADVTLSTTNGAANQARQAVLLCTGSRSVLRTITAPAQSKAYIVINATTGGYGVKVVGSGPTAGVTIANGRKALIAWNGSDFVIVSSSVIDLTTDVTGTLPVANGGTGVTSSTGTGSVVLSNSPVLTTPNLGTPSAATLTNATGLPLSTGVTGTLPVANGGTGGTTQSAARTGLGATTLGANLFTITNPSAVTFPRFNADNTVSALNAADFRTAIGAGTGTGDVVGPASATDSALVAFNGTTGKLIKQAATVTVAQGGTGQTTYTNGQLLIGNSTGNTLTKATLTQGTGITITNGSGAITIANASPMAYPGAGIPNSTGTAWGTSYSTTGSGTVVALATSPSFTTPTLGVASATTINKVTITAPATGSTLTIADGKTLTANSSLTLAGTDGKTLTTNASLTLAGVDGKTLTTNNSLTLAGTDGTTMTFPSASASVGYLNIPAVADKTSAYILATGDVGKVVGVGTGGSIEIPNSTFAAGDAVLIFNNTSAGITITCTITTAYIAGTDADKATVTLATRGLANILFISGTACVITGNVS